MALTLGEIAKGVQEGAAAYLSRQFRTLGVFVVLVLALLPYLSDLLGYLRDVFDEEQADLIVGSHGRTIPIELRGWLGDFRRHGA